MAPASFEQLDLGHNSVPMVEQVNEEIESLRLEVYRVTAATQLATDGIELALAESVHARQSPSPGHSCRWTRIARPDRSNNDRPSCNRWSEDGVHQTERTLALNNVVQRDPPSARRHQSSHPSTCRFARPRQESNLRPSA